MRREYLDEPEWLDWNNPPGEPRPLMTLEEMRTHLKSMVVPDEKEPLEDEELKS